jgi:hypothetical protein
MTISLGDGLGKFSDELMRNRRRGINYSRTVS